MNFEYINPKDLGDFYDFDPDDLHMTTTGMPVWEPKVKNIKQFDFMFEFLGKRIQIPVELWAKLDMKL